MKNKLVSPINGSELSLTEKENIFYSESDGLYYRQDSNNKIIPLISPINASPLSFTDKENIYYSKSDGLYYRQDSNNKIIPLTSPINASALSLTDKENIFYSELDGLYYRQDSNNKIIPLVSPINGIGLIPITNKIFLDQATNSYFIMKENKLTLVPIEEIENLNIQTKQHKTK